MSQDNDDNYEVGFGKPPVAHRFKTGKSGNPKGRPRKVNGVTSPSLAANRATDDLILQEAYRPVTIREGEKTITLPAIQASTRSLTISAMKGSRLAQKQLTAVIREIEERHSAERSELLDRLLTYKLNWTMELERRRRNGINEPDPVPHPDDIIFNYDTCEVSIQGPRDEAEKRKYDELLARRAMAQDDVSYYADYHQKHPSEEWCLQEWHQEQNIFDLINDCLPMRYKAKLKHRSFAEGASREGQAFEYWSLDKARRDKLRKRRK